MVCALLNARTAQPWLWWLPVYLRQAGRQAVPAIVGGLVLTVAGQATLHGLDVHVLTGLLGALAGAILGGLFAASVWRTRGEPAAPGAAWGAVVLWPYLFLRSRCW